MTLSKLREALTGAIAKLMRASLVDRKVVEEVIRDIQRALLMADVNVRLVLDLSNNIREKALKADVPPGFSRRDVVIKTIYEELVKLLGGERPPEIDLPKGRGYTLMLVGIQGSGKTTSAAKLAYFYKRRGYRVALVCADTYRPGAYDQLRQLAERIGVPVYGPPDAKSNDPVEIAVKGVKHFRAKKADLIIIDTAGRHKDEESLMKEMREMAAKIRPDEVMLVIDGTIGQQAGSQAKAFHEAVPLGSIMITKLDGTARGGGALSAVAVTGARIKFIGVGEKIDEIEPFDPPRFVSRLLGMGDLKALIDKMREAESLKQQERLLRRAAAGKLTLEDLYEQMLALRRMGPLAKILELLPGFGLALPREALDQAEDRIDKWIAIIQSMTPEERRNPRIINRSRMERIARGSGTTVKDVKELLDYYNLMTRSLRQLMRRGRRLRGLGLPGLGAS